MKQTIMILVTLVMCAALVAGCAGSVVRQHSLASTSTLSPPFIKCVGEFTNYEAEYPWFENWVDKDGNESHGDGSSPRATFRITTPAAYTGHVVGVLFKYEGKDLPPSPDESKKGKTFSFEVPEDFFTGKFGTIDNIHVRNLKMEP